MLSKGEQIIEKAESGIAKYRDDFEELRRRIILLAVLFVGFLAAGVFITAKLYPLILNSELLEGFTLHVFSPWEAIEIYMQFATIFAIAMLLPFLIYNLWGFIAPGLTDSEKSATKKYIPFALLSFLVGLVFAYFVVFPSTFWFTIEVAHKLEFTMTLGATQFFSYFSNILLAMAVIFELPALSMFLTSVGVIRPKVLKKVRRWAYVVLCVVGTALTPPDFISDLLIMVPLILLYEASVALSVAAYKKRMKKKAAKLAAQGAGSGEIDSDYADEDGDKAAADAETGADSKINAGGGDGTETSENCETGEKAGKTSISEDDLPII